MQGLELRQALGAQPQRAIGRRQPARRAALRHQRVQPGRPVGLLRDLGRGDEAQAHQHVVHFLHAAHLRPGLAAHRGDGLGIEVAEVAGGGRIDVAAADDRLGAALLQRRIVEEGVGPRAEDLCGEGRGRGEVACHDLHLAALDLPQQGFQAVDVHGLVEAVAQGLRHQRVIGHLALADDVLQAGHLVGKHGGEQVFRLHALDLRRDLPAADVARQGQGRGGVPAPARGEHGRVEQGLHQHVAHGVGVQELRHVGQGETVAGGQRQHDGLFRGRGLQLEIEAAAEAFAQGQAPGAVEAHAVGRVDHQLGAAGLVEETLHGQATLRGHEAQRGLARAEVVDDLARGFAIDAGCLHQAQTGFLQAFVQPVGHRLAQARHGAGQLVAAPRRLADPEGNARRCALGILHAQAAALHAQDAVGSIAQLEDVAGHAFHGEILVHAADELRLRLQHHLVIGRVGNRAAGGERGEARAGSRAQHAVDCVAMQVGGGGAAARGVALGQHAQHGGVLLARQPSVRPGAAQHLVQCVLIPVAAGHLGDDALRQHVHRLRPQVQAVQLAAAHGVEQGGALDQVVARLREQAPLGRGAHGVAGAPDALQEGRDGARGGELAHQVHVADVDAEFQRRGGHEYAQLAALELLLGVQAQLLGQAAVVCGDALLAQQLGQVPRGALGHAPGVDEHQGGAVLLRELCQAREGLRPLLARHHRAQRRGRQLDGEIAVAHVAGVDDLAVRCRRAVHRGRRRRRRGGAAEEARHLIHGLLRGRQADAQQAALTQCLQPLQRQREVAAALVRCQGVHLVHDHAARGREQFAAGLRAQQHVQGFRRGHQDVRREAFHPGALQRRRVAGAHGGADGGAGQPAQGQLLPDAAQGLLEVDADVVGQRLQRRDVDHARLVRQRALRGQAHQLVDGGEEGRQGLARAGGGGDERVASGLDGRPGPRLCRRGRGEAGAEPGGDRGMEAVEHDVAGGREGSGGHGGEMGTGGRKPTIRRRRSQILRQEAVAASPLAAARPATAPGRFRGAVGVSAAA